MRTFFIALFTLAIAAPAGAQAVEQPASASPAPEVRLRDLVAALDRDNPELKASRREIDMAIKEMARLKQALGTYATEWSAADVARAQAAIARFEQRLSLQQVFDPPPVRRRTTAQRMAKWKNSLRKLPAKMGLR